MDNSPSSVAIALLYETPGLGAHMRDALAQLGTVVVYDEATHALDRDALVRSRANVVVVNLDAQNDPDLDQIYELVSDGRYRVIFNDGDVSSALSGWDHARWLRHLAAKILGGTTDIDPPRPAGAEPVPTHVPADAGAHTLAETPADAVSPGAPAPLHAPDPMDEPMSSGAAGALEPIDFDALPEPPAPAQQTIAQMYASIADDAESVAVAAPAFDQPVAHTDTADTAGDEGTLDLLDLDADGLLDVEADHDPENPDGDTLLPFQIEDATGLAGGFDEDFSLAGSVVASAPVRAVDPDFADGYSLDFDETASSASTPPVMPTAPDWTLDDLVELPPAPFTPARPADFGIETVRPEEFLAPVAEDTAAHFDASAESALELIPLEEAVAPTPIEAEGRESWLDSAAGSARKTRIQRVWVLGASIGGPESVREFLALLPRDFPALFLVAQHLGSEFVDLMIQQLAKATPLTVRTPGHGDRASHGEVLVVPTSQRLLVGEDGVVVLERDQEEHAFSPSIDRVLRDVADRFGAKAGAIIFSGMSDDAAEGCRYLAGKGGHVYAQEPDTCVISTMIDGVCETGVVGFLGSPQALAEKLLDERD